jgi:hypothetical protein
MTCPLCNTENGAAALYCRRCGSKLSKATQSLSSEESRRVEEDETIREAVRVNLRAKRILTAVVWSLLIVFGGWILFNITKPDPVKEAIRIHDEKARQINIGSGIVSDCSGVLLACLNLSGKSENKLKEDCSALYTILDKAEARLDDITYTDYRYPAETSINNAREYLRDHTPCGPDSKTK